MKKLIELYHRWKARRLHSALQKKISHILQLVDQLVEDIRFHRQFPESTVAVANLKKSRQHLEMALSALEKHLPKCEDNFCQAALAKLKLSIAGIG